MYPTTRAVFTTTVAIVMLASGALGQESQLGDCAQPNPDPLHARGCAVLEDYLAAFNARDSESFTKTLNFPHVRIASGAVRVWNTSADYAVASEIAIGQLELVQAGWGRSAWDYRRLVQRSDNKLHFSRAIHSFSRVRLFVHEAKRKVRIFSVSCRSAMNFVRESLFAVSP